MEQRDKLRFSVSATTRAPREGEVDGVDYFFVSRERFQQMVDEGAFLEHAEYVGNCYGTPRAPVEQQLAEGYDVYLDIDVQGAMQVKALRPETLMIFLMPPSMEELERRLVKRGNNSPEEVHARLAAAEREFELKDRFDHVVVNDVVERAVDEISGLIDQQKQKNKQVTNQNLK
jgi:guanylate kinase